MTDTFEIEAQGDHEFVVRLRGKAEVAESWFRLTPGVLADLDAGPDEEELVRRTVTFLLQYQDIPDFPAVVEIEDVMAIYPDFAAFVRSPG
jgi:hypothetical protein